MSVAKVTELSCTSPDSFEDAIRQGIERANKTLRGVRSAWVKEQRVIVNSQVENFCGYRYVGANRKARRNTSCPIDSTSSTLPSMRYR